MSENQSRAFYMTQEKKEITPQQEIQETHTKLLKTIEELETHIQDAVRKHQAQFLFAYRNHLKKVKKQLAELRKISEDQEREFSSNDKIVHLQKQITLFREEALKLYDKLDFKTREVDELKLKIKLLQKQNEGYEKDVKELVKKVKTLELQLGSSTSKQEIQERSESPMSRKRQLPAISQPNIEDIKSLANISQTGGLKQIESLLQPYVVQEQLAAATRDITLFVRNRDMQSRDKDKIKRKSQQISTSDGQLRQWFLDCVNTIKKEIFKRKQQQTSDAMFIPPSTDLREFLTFDKLRLLEIFLNNERLLSHMYLKLFPDRLTEVTEMLTVGARKSELSEDRPRNNSMVDRSNIQYEFQDLSRPQIAFQKQRQPRNLLRNRVMIKNGKLNFSNF